MQFRKKSIIIHAWSLPELVHSNPVLLPAPIVEAIKSGLFTFLDSGEATIKTPEGDQLASKDDWIIQGRHGELYPCKPDIFVATYELVED